MIWIFWVYQLSPVWYNIDHSHSMSQFDRYQLQLVYLTLEHCPARSLQHETSQTILTCSISCSTFSTHCTNLFLHFSGIFTFLEIIKHTMPIMLHIFFHLWDENDYTKIHQFGKLFKNTCWYDSCHNTIQQNCFKWS